MAGDRQQDEEYHLGVAGELLNGLRIGSARARLELRGLDESLHVRHLLRDQAPPRIYVAAIVMWP